MEVFKKLEMYQPRGFVPEDAELRDKETVISLYQALIDRHISSSQDLEKWIMDRSELEAAIDQAGSILYIQMTCHTDHEEYARNYTHFMENIIPAVKPLENALDQKYLLLLRENFELDKKRYQVYDRSIHADVKLFRQENVPLQTQVDLLSQEYQKICGAMTVHFNGKEQTLAEMNKYLQDPDYNLREDAWRMIAQRREQDRKALDEIFSKMLDLRHQVARNAGFKNFCDYQFEAYHRFDYTPEECKAYHKTIEKKVVPVWKKILERRKKQMKVKSLRPWDTAVDPLGRAPLRPFEKVDKLVSGVQKIFDVVDPQLGGQFRDMKERGLLDLASRKGKAPGGYQNTLAEARQPFIFMNAVGLDYDVRTLLHEGGHAFHAKACTHDPLYAYRHAPMEFCEVASMSMELLADEYLTIFYREEDAERSRQEHLEGVVHVLAWVATVDAFQHWIYENPRHSIEERTEAWVEIYTRFGGGFLDWEGLESFRESLWHRQLHIFEVPFYYIEYGIAQLGALQVWKKARGNRQKALDAYREALALGGSRPLPELFKTAGVKFDFSEETIVPLVEIVQKELGLVGDTKNG
ncbi:MAG: M3 family oligoendopeptidase [Candidatus Omnitrophica bacterium]|nr:M3 family oligoendopeptidase [Candidatus Omnitrophota bacterium]